MRCSRCSGVSLVERLAAMVMVPFPGVGTVVEGRNGDEGVRERRDQYGHRGGWVAVPGGMVDGDPPCLMADRGRRARRDAVAVLAELVDQVLGELGGVAGGTGFGLRQDLTAERRGLAEFPAVGGSERT